MADASLTGGDYDLITVKVGWEILQRKMPAPQAEDYRLRRSSELAKNTDNQLTLLRELGYAELVRRESNWLMAAQTRPPPCFKLGKS